jgi:nitroreductase
VVPERDFFAVVGRQRACRAFDRGRDVGDDLVELVLDAARFAPSSENSQPWVFVVIRDPEGRRRLTDLMARLYATAMPADMAPRVVADVNSGFDGGFATAPVWIVAAGDDERAEPGEQKSSVFPAVQNLLLAATALGLGSAMTTIASFDPAEVRDITGLPATMRPYAMIPLGWPAKTLGPPHRRPVSEIAHRDTYGTGW